MDGVFGVDWGATLAPDTPLLEIFVRGSVTYIALFMLLRIIPKRESGAASITDLLVIVLIADAAQNAMSDDYTSITDGLLLVATIIFWSWMFNWLSFRFPRMERLLSPPSLPLVRDGRMLRRNMQKEMITEDELLSQLRLQGVSSVSDVKEARIESDGRISVVCDSPQQNGRGAEERKLS